MFRPPDLMSDLLRLWFLFFLLLPDPTLTAENPTPVPPTAVEVFESLLDREGLDPALARLRVILEDPESVHAVDGYDLAIGLPARLVLRHQRDEALQLLVLLEPRFGDHPRYWQELGIAHLRCGNSEEAAEALTRAVESGANRPDLEWMVENIEDLAAVNRQQASLEETLVPGQTTGLHGPYLGQKPPGRIPQVFAPGILNTTSHEYHVSFGPDGKEIVFSRSIAGSLITRWEEDGWTVPESVYFIDENHLTEEANLTPDGRAIVFCGRPQIKEPRYLYRAERQGKGWGPPTRFFPGMYATSTLDGSIYYTTEGEGRDYGVIVKRKWTGSDYEEPVVVEGPEINTPFPDAHPWIAPDENLLLFDSYRDPNPGVYVSFRLQDGSWSRAVSVHDKLGIPPVGQPAMSHDLKYLFFCLAGDMYWVDAEFLWELAPEEAIR